MEWNQFKSVVALVDSLVRSAHARRSCVLLRNLSVRVPVSSRSLTDFSICSILELENDVTQSSPGSGKLLSLSLFFFFFFFIKNSSYKNLDAEYMNVVEENE